MQEQEAQQELAWSQQRAFDDAYDRNKRKLWLAYLLAVLFGCIGVHRLYLGRKLTGWLMFGIWMTGLLVTVAITMEMPDPATATIGTMIAGLLMLSTWTWVVIDLFLIPHIAHKFNAALALELKQKMIEGSIV